MDSPENLLPHLELYGIEEIERGVCEDNAENRKALRANGLGWQVIYNDDGTLSPNILAISPAMSAAKSSQWLTDRVALLADDREPDGDYKTGTELLDVPDIDTLVPAWVLSGTKYYEKLEERRLVAGDDLEPALTGPPERCHFMKTDGHRCLLWTNGRNSYGMCRTHMQTARKDQNTPGMMVERARIRIKQAAIHAVDQLEALAYSAENENVRLAAVNSLLDRGGIRGGHEVDSNVRVEMMPAEKLLRERLEKLQRAQADIAALEAANTEDAVVVEAEEVDDDAE